MLAGRHLFGNLDGDHVTDQACAAAFKRRAITVGLKQPARGLGGRLWHGDGRGWQGLGFAVQVDGRRFIERAATDHQADRTPQHSAGGVLRQR